MLTDPRLPESDTIVHVAVWALAVTLVGFAVWRWIGLLVGAAVRVRHASLVVEVAQGRLTDTRAVEASDVRGNLAGVALGTVVVAFCYVLTARWPTCCGPRGPAAIPWEAPVVECLDNSQRADGRRQKGTL